MKKLKLYPSSVTKTYVMSQRAYVDGRNDCVRKVTIMRGLTSSWVNLNTTWRKVRTTFGPLVDVEEIGDHVMQWGPISTKKESNYVNISLYLKHPTIPLHMDLPVLLRKGIQQASRRNEW